MPTPSDAPTTALSTVSLTSTTYDTPPEPLTDAAAQAAHVASILTPNPSPPPSADFPSLRTERDAASWSLFGRSGKYQQPKTTRASWTKASPFKSPVSTPWRVPLPTSQFVGNLIRGYRPLEMEDKWFVYADGPAVTASGSVVATVNFHRSWTGDKVASAELELGEVEAGQWTGEVVGLVYEKRDNGVEEEDDEEGAEAMAKFIVVEVCRHVLRVKLEPEEEVKEPRRWREVLAKRPFEANLTTETKTVYKGTSISKETLDHLLRLSTAGGPIRLG